MVQKSINKTNNGGSSHVQTRAHHLAQRGSLQKIGSSSRTSMKLRAPITHAAARELGDEPSKIEVSTRHEFILLDATTETQVTAEIKVHKVARRYLGVASMEIFLNV